MFLKDSRKALKLIKIITGLNLNNLGMYLLMIISFSWPFFYINFKGKCKRKHSEHVYVAAVSKLLHKLNICRDVLCY